ncbi:EHT1 [[Candida] subhashii]|uniref:EHT1 n=1 Tax=[Candida] subhashii TaxID=561895 RepID=A0A8J5UYE1_9ASCO|nr:EHT1 [[Candida] subhashii]KAG7662989.1 EHT1 [[Candida] subhashii]
MGILNWGFRSNIKIHQCQDEKSIQLITKKDDKIKFSEFVKDNLSLIDESKKLWLNPLLFNGSLQTLYYTSADSSKKFQIYYGRELFTYNDGGICSLDWVIPKPESKDEFKELVKKTLPEGFPKLHPRTRYFTPEELESRHVVDEESTTPIVVIFHGLAGGSHEALIRNLAESIHKNCNDWDTVVVNNRGCCRTKITTGALFNAGSTGDIREVLVDFKKRYPNRPIYAVGFSFGAAMLSNFLGEEEQEEEKGGSGLVKAACAVGCPWDFVDSAYHIENSWTGKYLINPAITQFLIKLVKNNSVEFNNHNPHFAEQNVVEQASKAKTTWQFDNAITCKTTPYANAFEYYRELSPARRLQKIKTPLLMINSTDDPAVGTRLPILDAKTNPYLCLVETDLGGHLGFVKSSGEFWCVEVVEQFFQKFQEVIN